MTAHEIKYIGTQLDPDEFRRFKVQAAESGKSRSALIRSLVSDFLTKRARSMLVVPTPNFSAASLLDPPTAPGGGADEFDKLEGKEAS